MGGVLLFILGSSLGGVGPVRGLRGEEEEGGVRSGPGSASTILLFHTISVRPSKQPHMVGSTYIPQGYIVIHPLWYIVIYPTPWGI